MSQPKTFLAQNQFISNSTVNIPRTVDQDVASPASDPAAIDSCQEPVAVDCIPEIFRVAHQLCAEARSFVPDFPGLYHAMLDPSAPRALDDDPVWADEAPLFLRNTA
jgi:hypothetical protein